MKDNSLSRHFPIEMEKGIGKFGAVIKATHGRYSTHVNIVATFSSPMFGKIFVLLVCNKSMFDENSPEEDLKNIYENFGSKILYEPFFCQEVREKKRVYVRLNTEGSIVYSSNPYNQYASKNRGVNFYRGSKNDTPLGCSRFAQTKGQ